ncbi:MAG: exodeoxyribonuclease V subunit alpha [Myxococcota bacterium]|nr:exodeoxyribonuclease V subunit alpha [Myxococcota bacterium]
MTRKTMAPLFAPVRDADPIDRYRTIERRLAPFFQAGVFQSEDLHVAARMGRRTGILDEDVILALALAIRAPRHAHTCVNLEQVHLPDLVEAEHHEHGAEGLEGLDRLRLPSDRVAWRESVKSASALVRTPADDRITPFVLDGPWLYIARFWHYQDIIVSRVHGWRGQTLSWHQSDGGLQQALDHLFRSKSGEPDSDEHLNRQRLAAVRALSQPFSVITGGPGMGKTWTVRNIIALLCLDEFARTNTLEPPRIALAAPTGKAAVRIRASLLNDLDGAFKTALGKCVSAATTSAILSHVNGLKASTLHRLLGSQRFHASRFRHHRGHPLPYDAVIVDEVSMVDFAMMAKLLDAISTGADGRSTRLILLGDRDQLASVEAGTVLADLCGPVAADIIQVDAGWVRSLPAIGGLDLIRIAEVDPSLQLIHQAPEMVGQVTQFNRTYRFTDESAIGQFARACSQSSVDSSSAVAALTDERHSGGCLLAVHGDDERALWTEVDRCIENSYSPYVNLIRHGWQGDQTRFPSRAIYWRRCLDVFDQFRILCAHRAGRRGVTGVNRRVIDLLAKSALNPDGLTVRGSFWRGRPILITQNDYSVNRFNGDIGLVFPDPDAQGQWLAVFPGADGLPSEADLDAAGWQWPEAYVSGELNLVETLSVARLPPHQTVFAMTIHKSQGSEFDHVMMVLPDGEVPSRILTRELVYTGVTRAKSQVTILADQALLARVLDQPVQRAGCLKAKLWAPSGDDVT